MTNNARSTNPIPEPPMQQLSTKMLEQMTERIVNAIHPERILLFGSHAWGRPTEDSDIDLLIIVPRSDQPSYRRAREVYRSLRGLPLPVEVIVRTRDEVAQAARVATSLERKIPAEGRVLHG
ncbi:MAG: nucleotidyltransferase domain-containing protein [Gammaproteobacteria bacterium]